MCRICGCAHQHDHHHHHGHEHHEPARGRRVAVETDLLAKNDRLAASLRTRLARDRIAVVNLIGAPGAGKTTLLERTLGAMPDVPTVVIEGDQATDHDARRIAATGCSVIQVNTGAGCHLDATMIERSLDTLAPAPCSLVLVENVGNLVCPALFDLGERAKVVVMSVTEGEDKPLKYPHVFRAATAMVLTKLDLAKHVDVDLENLVDNARRVQPALQVFGVSSKRVDGLASWCSWLREQHGASS